MLALANSGEAGTTLEHRKLLVSNIKAKTGSMSGISCLCGYGISQNPMVFVFIANSFAPPNKEIFPVIDGFVNRFVGKHS